YIFIFLFSFCFCFFFFLMLLRPPISTLFPYTTLFRSYYAKIGRALADGKMLKEGAAASLSKTGVFAGQHFLVPTKGAAVFINALDRKSTRLNSSHLVISYAVFCLKKKKKNKNTAKCYK